LFSRDPDSILDLGPMHEGVSSKRIDAIILAFKKVKWADAEVARLKKDLLDNIGAHLIASDANGFEIKTAGRTYVTVRHGATLVFLSTGPEEEALRIIASKLQQKW
jgi:tryptophanase